MKCRFCDEGAVAVFSLSAGCVCHPNDREQALCAQHIERATPLGTMTRIASICLTVLLCACSTIRYEHGDVRFTRTTFGGERKFQELEVVVDPIGTRRMILRGYDSNDSRSLEAVARGAAEGAVKGAVPLP